jgi:hypothetical protein
MFHYRNLDWHDVAREMRASANRAVAYAAGELGISQPWIQWFKDASPGEKGDWTANRDEKGHAEFRSPHKIWLSIGQTSDEAAKSAAHEVRHLWHFRYGYLDALDFRITTQARADAEFDADAYSQQVQRRIQCAQ